MLIDDKRTFGEIYELNIEEYENIDIDDIDFSVRVNNRLHRGNIATVAALLRCTGEFLSGISGFGAGCFKEIHDFCKKASDESKRANGYDDEKRQIPRSIYEQREHILKGEFEYLSIDEAEKEIYDAYKEAYNSLDVELVEACVENPCYVSVIRNTFNRFSKAIFGINELLENVPTQRRAKNAKRFINACTYSASDREELLGKVFDDDETLESFIRKNATDIIDKKSSFQGFISDCAYDLYGMIAAFFDDIKKNERAYEIVKHRAEGQTLEEVGNLFTVTRERIRQIEKKVSTKFIAWLRRYSVLKKIVAEKDGVEVLVSSDFEIYFKEYAPVAIHFLKVYEDEINNFEYDKGLDVFVYGNTNIIADVQAYVEELPAQFNEIELNDILCRANELYGYPFVLTERTIEADYNKTGDVYHRSRLTLGKVYADILTKYYENGIWIYSDSELEQFRKHVIEDYGDIKLPENNRAFIARIASVGILCGRGTYGPKKIKYISDELATKIHTYITESESPIFLTNTIYNVFEEELQQEGITNKYYLQGVLRELYGEEFVFRRDYVSKDGNLTSVYSEIVRYIERAIYPVTKQQIVDAFPGVTEIVINISISDPDVLNLFGVYIHSNKLQFEKSDIDYLKSTINTFTKSTECIHVKNLFDYIQRDNPTLLNNNGVYQAFGLFSVMEYLFRDIMEFSRPYIGKKGAVITRTFDQLHEMVEASDVIALADILSVARENHFQINSILEFANSCNTTHLLINDKELAAVEYVGIDETIAMQIEESIIDEISGTMYISDIPCIHKLANLNVPWTNWLIYSIILKWSERLDVAVTSTTFRQAQPLIALKGKLEMDSVELRENVSDVYLPDNLDDIDALISDIILDEIEV